ncbi:MAG: type I pullulanase, partial [Erysipelotrichia bacterium]|nr:type I pullulanase [Erysipelotrichia bacterium]
MPLLDAYLDDFGKVTVYVSRRYYSGHAEGFYLSDDAGSSWNCVVRRVEEQEQNFLYELIIPADLNFGRKYWIRDSRARSIPLKFRFIVRTPEFDRQFTYDGEDLGAVYHKDHTDFAVWAPTAVTVMVRICTGPDIAIREMKRTARGVYRASVDGDLQRATYVYIIERNGETMETADPYALSSSANGHESAVIDLSRLEALKDDSELEPMRSAADAVIYEVSVRDFTSHDDSGSKEHGTFGAFHETGTSWDGNSTGFDYLCRLGITHVQFQPLLDFASVDELQPKRNYNWGYDPSQLIGLDGSFTTAPADPYSRMLEFKKLIIALHKKGIRVNMDLVFNHMFEVERSAFDCCVPYYYYRYNASGFLSNGSYCGNDLDSKRPMLKKLIVHSIAFLMKEYGVDGFRFDLMGILDVDTMNDIRRLALSINPDAMIYGEGWDMPTALNDTDKAKIYNQNRMPGIGHFNDAFRDVVKGQTGDDQLGAKGYATGNLALAFDMCSVMAGNTLETPYFKRFEDPIQSINAVETHDNSTLWDKMHSCCSEEPREVRKKRQKMMIACTMTAQGIPFLHAGEEYCGTKQGSTNSYNAGDDINGMNWQRMAYNIDVVKYTSRCVALRKKYRA